MSLFVLHPQNTFWEMIKKMDGGELIAQVLKKQGVRFLFTLCGGHISPILVGAKKQGIRVIDVRQEPTAISM